MPFGTDTSHGVSSPSAHGGWEQQVTLGLPGPSLPACSVTLRFTPFTPFPSAPALFRAGGALGVAPSRALLIPTVRTPLGASYPRVVSIPFALRPASGVETLRTSAPVGEAGGGAGNPVPTLSGERG
jgi:hypothetical protein